MDRPLTGAGPGGGVRQRAPAGPPGRYAAEPAPGVRAQALRRPSVREVALVGSVQALARRVGLDGPRLLAVGAATAVVTGRGVTSWVWLPAVAVLACTWLEPVLRAAAPSADAVQLPGYAARDHTVVLRRLALGGAALAGVLLAVAFLAPGWAGWTWAAAGVAQAGAFLAAAGWVLRLRAGRPARAEALRAALADYAPRLVVYTARGTAVYQLPMWLPLLDRLGHRYVVLTRDPAGLAELARVTDAPVVARESWRELDDAVVPSLRVALYVNSIAANADFVTYRQLTHVYVGHGESDKALSYHPAHAMYDRVFVAGHAAARRYARNGVVIPPEKLVVVGRPQAAQIRPARAPMAELEAPVCLYAPTWSGYNAASSYSSLAVGEQVVRALLDRAGAVVFRPHPLSRSRPLERPLVQRVEALLRADAERTGRPHRWDGRGGFVEDANAADAMVADLSSVLTEFLYSGKPMAVVVRGSTAAQFAATHEVTRAAYLVEPDLANLSEVVGDLLGDDPLAPARAQVLAELTGGMDGAAATRAFEAAVNRLLDPPPPLLLRPR